MVPLLLFFASIGASALVQCRLRTAVTLEQAQAARREVVRWLRDDPCCRSVSVERWCGSYLVVVWGTFRSVQGPVEVLGVPVEFRWAGDPAPEDDWTDAYGELPPPATPTSASVLQSAALAPAGSWTQRNVLQAGAQSAWQRRLAGTADEADWAVLRAARPGIASSRSGPISPGWSRSPWQFGPKAGGQDLGDLVAEEMGL